MEAAKSRRSTPQNSVHLQRTLQDAAHDRRRNVKATFEGWVTDLIVASEAGPTPRPQAFLVEQDPGWTLPVHFHQEHQFQLFVSGSGLIGRHAVTPLTVHYASPHSGYGPLVAGAQGVAYLTLRAVGDVGAWYLPGQRDQLLPGLSRHQAQGAPSTRIDARRLHDIAEATQETLIEPMSDGPGAWLLRVPAGQNVDPPLPPAHHGGRFLVVTQGGLLVRDEELPALATAWTGAGEAPALRAGHDGLELVVLQFPPEAARSFVEAHGLRRH